MIKKVLVAVDGSEIAHKTLNFALDLTEKYGAVLTIINVCELPAVGSVPQDPTGISSESMVAFTKDLDKIHQEILKKAVSYAKAVKPNITINSKLREGDPASQIIAEAKETSCDIIVVGHKGVGKVKEFLGLGGISEKIAHLSPCAVVIVR